MSSKKRTEPRHGLEGFQDGSICYQILYGTRYQTHHYFQRMVLYTPLGTRLVPFVVEESGRFGNHFLRLLREIATRGVDDIVAMVF